MSNNEWAAQRRGGAAESRANNVIYIGRASFRMEPAPLLDDDIDDHIDDERVAQAGQPGLGGEIGGHNSHADEDGHEDLEAPYLKLRTSIDDNAPDAASPPLSPPVLDLTEFAVVAEQTGVELVPPPFHPRAVAPTLVMLPDGPSPEPATETLLRPKSKVLLSRSRLAGWGALAFSAGLVASAGAHMLVVTPARLGAIASAAPLAQPVAARPALAPPAAATVIPAPAAEAPVAPTTADPAPVALAVAAAMPAPVHTRAGASPPSRGKIRARGKTHPEPRSGSGSTATAEAETDWAPASASSPTVERAAPTPTSAPHPASRGAGWVDPFAE